MCQGPEGTCANRAALCFLSMLLLPAAAEGRGDGDGDDPETTTIDEVVMYAIDDDTNELVRYSFGTEFAQEIGVLTYPDGNVAGNVECLAFIPSGLHKGLYGVDNYDGNTRSRLVKINVLDATATPPSAADVGFGNVEGMVALWDPDLEEWYLGGTQAGSAAGADGNEDGVLYINWWVNGLLAGNLQPPGEFIDAFDWWNYVGEVTTPYGVHLAYDLNANPDGLITGNFVVENTSIFTADVELEIVLPLASSQWGTTELMGSGAIGLTTDAGGGTLSLLEGTPLWRAFADGLPMGPTASMFSDPFELNNDGLGSVSASESFGIPDAIDGPAAIQTIGIRTGFSLTTGDQMSITGVLSVAGGDDAPLSNKHLIRIDPETGQATPVMSLGQRFEGLAKGSDGTLYAARSRQLWTIDVDSDATTPVGQHAYSDVEALEFAFGDGEPGIDVPGVPPDWTAGGVLFGYSDSANSMVIINPANGQAVAYECAIDWNDFEGIVFMTELRDPFGPIVASVGD